MVVEALVVLVVLFVPTVDWCTACSQGPGLKAQVADDTTRLAKHPILLVTLVETNTAVDWHHAHCQRVGPDGPSRWQERWNSR